MTGFGISHYGTSSYGTGFGALTFVNAYAISTNTVLVTLTIPAKSQSPTMLGDALNPNTWIITRLDNDFEFTIVSVTKVSPTQFQINTLESFGSNLVQHKTSSSSLLASNGYHISTPSFATFYGVLADATSTPDKLLATQKFSNIDIANPPAPIGSNILGGTLVITPNGDYDSVQGVELVKKLIIRRLTTRPGEFFHLPNYGIGINVKEPLTTSDLIKLKREVERQISEEPEVSTVSAPITFEPSTGILTILINAKLRRTGTTISVPLTVPTINVVL